MLAIQNLLDKYRSITIERVNEFLTKNSIEHKCTELRKIEFKFEDWSWDLYIDNNYFKIHLAFTTTEENINILAAEKACIELAKRVKVLKAYYISHEFVDEDKGNELVKSNLLLFEFESFCYNMYDFSKLFYDALNVILVGNHEYNKLYEEIVSTLPTAPVGFRNVESVSANEQSQPTDRHHIGFV